VKSELLCERDVEHDYRLSVPWLRRARLERQGPVFLRLGKRMIRYRRADIEAYLASRVVDTRAERPAARSTSRSGRCGKLD
jgi:predicted DNA-binding transcriptional regulator AlpA